MKLVEFQVYDAINDNPECPNITYPPDENEEKSIIEFHTCRSFYLGADRWWFN